MTWEGPVSPFQAAAASVGAFLTAQQQAKKDRADADRQAALDKTAAATSAADIAYKNQQTTHQHAEDVAKGYALPPGAIPPSMPTQAPGKPPPSNRDLANYYSQLGVFYTKNGALEGASTAVGLADKYGVLAEKEESAQLALRKEANTEIETQARIHHWTAQEKEEAKKTAAQLTIAAGHDATSIQNTQARVAAMIQAANIGADARVKAAGISASGALQRERETTRGANQRATGSNNALMARTKYVQGQENLRASGKAGSAKFRNINPTTQFLMAKEARDAISAGATRDAVLQRMAKTHGISVDEAEGILDDNDPDNE